MNALHILVKMGQLATTRSIRMLVFVRLVTVETLARQISMNATPFHVKTMLFVQTLSMHSHVLVQPGILV